MAKIFKFTGYYIDPNGGIDPEDVSLQLQEIGLDVFDHHVRVEEADVGRVLPPDYLYFSGDGKRNHFRNEYDGGQTWDWSLPSPYES